ncbi:hypothetical protein SeLEV6574_g06453 [Synchytrium endobioticum]|uniref:Replication protein A C-terminal domain-containing protein n=1 Tax=Synchytrium endobioticum TaxID=286115 RepID=A0A507CNN7_9FUNG|nr:hypothetical protein SeLEV6574_g06453 [Synchytrium endobioticum]
MHSSSIHSGSKFTIGLDAIMSGYGGFSGFGGGPRPMGGGGGGMAGTNYGNNQGYNQSSDYGNGGGFMSQPAGGYSNSQTDSPTRAGGGGGGKRVQNQSLRPVTIQQFHEARQVVPDGPYMLDGAELTNIVLAGRVTSLNEQSTTITYGIDDGTGQVTARKWLDADDNSDAQAQKRGYITDGMEVKVFGAVGKPFTSKNNAGAGDKTMTVYFIKPVIHPDEITLHNLEAQFAHFYHTKGPLRSADQGVQQSAYGQQQQQGGYGGFNSNNNAYNTGHNSHSNNQPSFGGPSRPINYGNTAYNQSSAPSRDYNNGFNALQNKIMDVCRAPHDGSGASVTAIVQQLRSHGSEAQIRQEIDFLSGEGHLFSTIDDEHFAVVEAGNV